MHEPRMGPEAGGGVIIPRYLYVSVPIGASDVDRAVHNFDDLYELVEVRERHSGAGAASSTLMIEKIPSATAPGAGTSMLAAAIALDATVNVPQVPALTATLADREVAAGDALSFNYTGTLTGLAGVVTAKLKRI